MEAGPILSAIPWILLIASSVFCLWGGLRIGVRFHAVLENAPLVGISTATKQDAEIKEVRSEIAELKELIKQQLATK